MRTCRFHPHAEAELDEALGYYESRRRGLGRTFLQEVKRATQEIARHPRRWPVFEEEIRRCLLRKFPFAVLYLDSPSEVEIIAVVHLRRRPGYWKDRN